MVDKIMDAANLFKAKLKRDELEAMLIEATSQDNWQASTNLLHQIANAAYNHDDWNRIQQFMMDKLKTKKWKKVLKTLSLVEFLLKNGPRNAISDMQNEQYTFKGLETFSCTVDGADKGQAIRQKAKIVVQLLVNSEHLEEERSKAANIKEKMGLSSTYSNARYQQPSTKSYSGSGSSYQGMGSTYQGMGSDSKEQGKSNKKYTQDEEQDNSYKGKIKGGLNYLKNTVAKANFTEFGGYIKDKVNNVSDKQREGLLDDTSPGIKSKQSFGAEEFNQFEYKSPSPITTSPQSGGLFANLNLKKTASGTKPVNPNPPPNSTPKITPNPNPPPNQQKKNPNPPPAKTQKTTNEQAIDLFSFDSEPAAPIQSKQPDIFNSFDNHMPQQTNTQQNATNLLGFQSQQSQPPAQPNLFQLNQPTPNPPANYSMLTGLNQKPTQPQTQPQTQPLLTVEPKTATKSSAVSWLSKDESSLIDFTSSSDHPQPTQTQSAPQFASKPVSQPMSYPMTTMPMMPMAPGPYPYQPYMASQYPQGYAIPPDQYQQFQQFLLFQQQQAALKGKQ